MAETIGFYEAQGRLAIAELVLFTPCFFGALWVTARHGFHRRMGWSYLVLLSVLRLTGASFWLAAVRHRSRPMLEAATILQNIAFAVLFLCMLGLLQRINEATSTAVLAPRLFLLLHLPFVIGIVVGIVAGIDDGNVHADPSTTNTRVQAAVVLVTAGFVALCGVTAYLVVKRRALFKSDLTLLWAVVLSIPLLLVRLVYSLVGAFSQDPAFELATGNAVLKAFMAVLEEFVVEVLYISVGLKALVIQSSDFASSSFFHRRAREPAREEGTSLQEIGFATRP
ncbi:MAG: hypothetical protein M1826_002761 [Phylliscum demangeonii]|nr:MAG: hypothetical protein M1826_002761 [Phylliscum demangeonii]